MSGVLPKGFEDLETLVSQWACATERERNAVRRSAEMADLEAYYQTVLPRMEAVMEYLAGQPPVNPPDDAARLAELGLMFVEVASSVEFYREADVPAGFSAERFIIHT
jgi:hypothetical protein